MFSLLFNPRCASIRATSFPIQMIRFKSFARGKPKPISKPRARPTPRPSPRPIKKTTAVKPPIQLQQMMMMKKQKKKINKKPAPDDPQAINVFKTGKFSQLYNESGKVKGENKAITSFDQLRIFPTVREAMIKEIISQYNLKGDNITKTKDDLIIKPTQVQIGAIQQVNQARKPSLKELTPKELSKMSEAERIQYEVRVKNDLERTKVFTIAAETGSGKTWAYLSCLLSKLKHDDMSLWKEDPEKLQGLKKSHTVRSIIMVPTNELVDQVYEVLQRTNEFQLENKDIPHGFGPFMELSENKSVGLSVMKLSHGEAPVKLFRRLETEGRIDVLVTTPGKVVAFSKLVNIDRPFRIFNRLKYCVLDEADTLFDDSFERNTTDIITHFPKLVDLILVSATIPKQFEKKITRLFPDTNSLIRVSTPALHKVPRGIKTMIIDADLPPYNGSKPRALAQAIYAITKDGTEPDHVKRIIVFVNEKPQVEGIVKSMIEKYRVRPDDIYGVSGSVNVQDRKVFLEPFLKPAELIKDDLYNSKVKILVTTDLLARGLNFQGVRNVILLGLPRNSIELVHRLGRTGRMNQGGRVFIIVDKQTTKSWIKGLGSAIIKGLKIG